MAPPPPAAPPLPASPHLPATAYLVAGDKIDLCKFENDEATCEDAGVSGIQDMVAMAVAGSNAYIASGVGPSAIFRCNVGAAGELSGCTGTENSAPEAARGLAIHGTTLYISGSSSPRVRMCDIQDDGSLATCVDAGFPAAMASDVEDIRIVGSTAYLLHNEEARISKCTVLAGGSLSPSTCADAGATRLSHEFGNPLGFAIAGDHMYIARFEKVIRCLLEPTGSLTGCADAGAGGSFFNIPSQVAAQGSSLYITDLNSNVGVKRCTLASDGLLTGCRTMYQESAHSIVLK